MRTWMDNIIGNIDLYAQHNPDSSLLPTTNDIFDQITHFTFIPVFMEMVGPYLEDSDQEVGPPPTLLQHIIWQHVDSIYVKSHVQFYLCLCESPHGPTE